MEEYLPILRSLHALGVKLAVIGTWALKAYFPEKMRDYVLQDCDLVLATEEANIRLAIAILNQKSWTTTVWEEHVDAGTPSPEFVGKYYVRAKQANLVLDLTYECKLDWQQMEAGIQWKLGLPLASLDNIVQLKRAKGLASDFALLEMLDDKAE